MDLKNNGQDNKLILRIHNKNQEGDTAFFRNRCLFTTVLEAMAQLPQKKFTILFHACSIGAEVYSFVIHYFLHRFDSQFEIDVLATDINSSFLQLALQGYYPDHILKSMTNDEVEYFQFSEQRFVTPIDKIRNKIKFTRPASFVHFETNMFFDIVFVLNALAYVPNQQQTSAIGNIAKYNSFLLCLSDFHPKTIKYDLQSAGYIPVTKNIKEICLDDEHEFRKIPDYHWRLCSIFKKRIAFK